MLRTRPAAPRAGAPPGRRGLAGGARVGLVVALAVAPGSAGARASRLAPTVEVSEGSGAQDLAEGTGDPGLSGGTGDAAARWTAEAQRREAQGDLAGAIAGWQRALGELPATQATAHRRAGLALAIAGAHAQLAARGVAGALPAAIAALDAYLASLDPTDDEHRLAVEQRRAELVARLAPPPRAAPVVSASVGPPVRRPDRRLMIAGGAALGLSAAAGATLAASLVAGGQAEQAVAAAVARPGDDPLRAANRDEALARGLRANRAAVVSAAVGGGLLLLGVTLLAVGATRRAPRAAWVPRLAADGLRWRF